MGIFNRALLKSLKQNPNLLVVSHMLLEIERLLPLIRSYGFDNRSIKRRQPSHSKAPLLGDRYHSELPQKHLCSCSSPGHSCIR
jgi:hypothetical protein